MVFMYLYTHNCSLFFCKIVVEFVSFATCHAAIPWFCIFLLRGTCRTHFALMHIFSCWKTSSYVPVKKQPFASHSYSYRYHTFVIDTVSKQIHGFNQL